MGGWDPLAILLVVGVFLAFVTMVVLRDPYE